MAKATARVEVAARGAVAEVEMETVAAAMAAVGERVAVEAVREAEVVLVERRRARG